MKKLPKGNVIITDASLCLNFLDENNNRYFHHVYNHGQGQFGEGIDSKSHIKQLWHNIKIIIKTIYYIIFSINFILFLREAKWRRNHRKFKNINEIKSFKEEILYIYLTLLIFIFN